MLLGMAVGTAACTVVLVSALTPGGGHVAVWMGVSSSDARNWLQAGIAKEANLGVVEYIEVGRRGRQVSLRTWPTTFGHKAKIRLAHRNGTSLWRITIDSHVSKWTWVPGARMNTLALLETYRQGGVVHGVARINGQPVRSP